MIAYTSHVINIQQSFVKLDDAKTNQSPTNYTTVQQNKHAAIIQLYIYITRFDGYLHYKLETSQQCISTLIIQPCGRSAYLAAIIILIPLFDTGVEILFHSWFTSQFVVAFYRNTMHNYTIHARTSIIQCFPRQQ